MIAHQSSEIHELRGYASHLGIALPDASVGVPTVSCFGHLLPSSFVWLCQHYPQHAGFPHHGWIQPMGLLSPFGHPSDLVHHNEQVRSWERGWPTHWVSFWHGNDGDYCFSFDKAGHPWVIYWCYNIGDQFLPHLFEENYQFATFADWFAGQVNWALAQQAAKRG